MDYSHDYSMMFYIHIYDGDSVIKGVAFLG